MVLGTASQGDADTLVRVRRTAEAASQFGSDGTLVRGMYEAKDTGGILGHFFSKLVSGQIGVVGAAILLSTLFISSSPCEVNL